MTEYRHFQPKDFINDPFFKAWILEKNTDAVQYWETWLQNNADKVEIVNQAKLRLLIPHNEINDSTKGINNTKNGPPLKNFRKGLSKIGPQHFRKILLVIAASFVLIAGLTLYFTDKFTQNSWLAMGMYFFKIPPKIVSTVNQGNTPTLFSLPDGSSVLLHPGCEINYPTPFSINKREVYLVGNAHFMVVKDDERPFIVKTAELKTQTVYGHFIVNAAKKEKTARVLVDSGAVLVSLRDNLFMNSIFSRFLNSSQSEVELTSGQEAVFNRIGEILTTIQQ